jgi:dTDP-4-dehydrorhamnose reductase
MKYVVVLGIDGQLGTALKYYWPTDLILIGYNRQLDIRTPEAIIRALAGTKPDLVVNCAAYTNVDLAEIHVDEAMGANHVGALNVARACAMMNIPLLHLSTDYVFSGEQQRPYRETDSTDPVNIYGRSKLHGERAIRTEKRGGHFILRVSSIYSPWGRNFVKTMLELATRQTEIRIVNDQYSAPTGARAIAEAIFTLARRVADRGTKFGTFHFCGGRGMSWFEFAQYIFDIAASYGHRRPTLVGITSAERNSPARRPRNSLLNCLRIYETHHLISPPLETELEHCIRLIGPPT